MFPFTDEELKNPVLASLERIKPMLVKDGGGIEFLGIKNAVVFVRLTGRCTSCPSSPQTLKYGVERQLKVDIHPDISLVHLPEGEEFC